MTNGYHHKVYVFGDQTKLDAINFGYSTNYDKFDLEDIIRKNPLHFSTAGNICKNLNPKMMPINSLQELEGLDLVARLKIEIDDKINLSAESLDADFTKSDKSGPSIYLLTRENYETEALNKRILGQDIKTLGSLIVRSVRATSVREGYDTLFLHACAVVDFKAKALYIIASDKDHAGKTPLVNDILRATPDGNLLSTALRLKVRRTDGACFAYPQAYGTDTNTIYTLIRDEEEKQFRKITNASLLDIGFKRREHPDNKLLAADKILMSIDGSNNKADLSEYRVFCIFASGASSTWDNKPKAMPMNKIEMQQKLYESWLSTWQFKKNKLFDKINTENYDKILTEKYSGDAQLLIGKLTNKTHRSFVYEGTPFNVKKHVLIEACKADILADGEKGLEWYHANAPEISDYVEGEFKKIRFNRHKQQPIDDYLAPENNAPPKPENKTDNQNSEPKVNNSN